MKDLRILIQLDGKTVGWLDNLSGDIGWDMHGKDVTMFELIRGYGRGKVETKHLDDFRDAICNRAPLPVLKDK